MKIFDLVEESESLYKSGVDIPNVLPTLSVKAFEHYVKEYNKILRMTIGMANDPVQIKMTCDMMLKKNNEELAKRGLKEMKHETKLDLI